MAKSFNHIKLFLSKAWAFVSRDIWRVNESEEKGLSYRFFNMIRTLILASRGFGNNQLILIASALTYYTMLAFIPILSIVLAVAKGFNAEEHLQEELILQFPGHTEVLNFAFGLVQSVLDVASEGVVMGVGIFFIIWSIWAIVNNIERAFNTIWQIPQGRKIYRKITDLFATMLILPLLLILSSGVSIYVRTIVHSSQWLQVLSPLLNVLLKLVPYFVSCLLFTIMYILLPNTRVRFKNAFIAGLLAGTAFQAFQYLYINGLIWVNRYNAFYGSFAAFPLLLLWLQLTWIIVLFGAEITFASQNIRNFYFEKETRNISHRYRYFFTLLIMKELCKRFERGDNPPNAHELSTNLHVPIKLCLRILNRLYEAKLIRETPDPSDLGTVAYVPAIDIHLITVGSVVQAIFDYGAEDFNLQPEEQYPEAWKSLCAVEEALRQRGDDFLIKDL